MKNWALSSGSPRVTIAIPTFNRAAWLPRCIGAALGQTFTDIEVVVSDNASADETEQVLAALQHPRLRSMRQTTNIGLNPNWNACLAMARGEYIVFVSDDDLIKPWMIECFMNLVREEPTLPVVVGLSDVYFVAENRISPAPKHRVLTTGIYGGGEILTEFLREQISTPMCSIMLRTDVLRASGGFPVDLDYAGDTIVWTSLLLNGRAGFVNDSCAAVSTHSANETSRLSLDTRLSCLRRTTDMLIARTNDKIRDADVRDQLAGEARRYFSRHAVTLLASSRKQGGTLGAVLATIWGLRGYLRYLRASDMTRIGRALAIIALPTSVTGSVRGLLRLSRRRSPSPSR